MWYPLILWHPKFEILTNEVMSYLKCVRAVGVGRGMGDPPHRLHAGEGIPPVPALQLPPRGQAHQPVRAHSAPRPHR